MSKEYDFVFTCKPINQTAKNVLCNGQHFDSLISISQYHSDAPLNLIKFTGKPEDNLTNKKVGRLTIIGFCGKRGNSKNKNSRDGVWLVRCDCGKYETRRTKSIKNLNAINMCIECKEIINYRARYNKLNYGKL